jgi:hypothetical protein
MNHSSTVRCERVRFVLDTVPAAAFLDRLLAMPSDLGPVAVEVDPRTSHAN